MDHRYGKRFPADLKTLIFKNGVPVALGCIRNFSREGAFVKTEFDIVDRNQALEIELVAYGNGRSSGASERRVFKTLVMHKSEGGMGLLLRDDATETQRNFAALLIYLANQNGAYNDATHDDAPYNDVKGADTHH